MLASMRYKNFTFPHNPRTYSISFERLTAVQKAPMGTYTLQDLGRTCRVMRGEGEFYGPGAYKTFKELATLFQQSGPGTLCHPVWQTSLACFTALTLTQEPRKDYVAYAFEFRECGADVPGLREAAAASGAAAPAKAAKSPAAAGYVSVQAGDTLWAIANDNGLTLGNLLKLNPGIANPNLITVGQKVRIA